VGGGGPGPVHKFGTGHGRSTGSETNAGVSNVNVYDLAIDGTFPTGGAGKSDINGIRIKSDASRGGLVNNVTYSNICTRSLYNPILLNPEILDRHRELDPPFLPTSSFRTSTTSGAWARP
jgi:polygalacturonase